VLIITRRSGERLMIGDDVVVEIMEIAGNSVRVGITAPRSIPVYREEIYAAVRDENRAAAGTDPGELPEPAEQASQAGCVARAAPGTVSARRLRANPRERDDG